MFLPATLQFHWVWSHPSLPLQMPKAELAVESKQSVADTQVFKPWREEPVNSGADASLATRRWVLQSLFGVRCVSGES